MSMKCSVESQGPSDRAVSKQSRVHAIIPASHHITLTGLPRRDAEVALRRVGEEAVGGALAGRGRGGGGPEQTADPGGDDARVYAEERRVEREDAEDPVAATGGGGVPEEDDLGG